jgi:transcriptional regulator with XRE-family HTH domain
VRENLREARLDAGLTQHDLGDALNVAQQAVWAWEKGTTTPRPRNRKRLADLLGVPARVLLENGSDRSAQSATVTD